MSRGGRADLIPERSVVYIMNAERITWEGTSPRVATIELRAAVGVVRLFYFEAGARLFHERDLT